jgi:hypothetical protein
MTMTRQTTFWICTILGKGRLWNHPRVCQIDQKGARAMAPPPGPRLHTDGLQGWERWHDSRASQAEADGGTRRRERASGEP